jgi:hypothetical protein
MNYLQMAMNSLFTYPADTLSPIGGEGWVRGRS